MRVRSLPGRPLVVGHKGAAALAPENTIASLEAALRLGVDIVEFDVCPGPAGLVLAHSVEELGDDPVPLEEALAFVADRASAQVGIDVDLKSLGDEQAVVDALRRHDLVDRALVCSVFPESLRLVKQLETALTTGISYPYDRSGVAGRPLLAPAVRAGLVALRLGLPYRIGGLVAHARADAAMLEHRVLSPETVDRCHRIGTAVFAWTVDDPADLRRVIATGVDGVISNDPRILSR